MNTATHVRGGDARTLRPKSANRPRKQPPRHAREGRDEAVRANLLLADELMGGESKNPGHSDAFGPGPAAAAVAAAGPGVGATAGVEAWVGGAGIGPGAGMGAGASSPATGVGIGFGSVAGAVMMHTRSKVVGGSSAEIKSTTGMSRMRGVLNRLALAAGPRRSYESLRAAKRAAEVTEAAKAKAAAAARAEAVARAGVAAAAAAAAAASRAAALRTSSVVRNMREIHTMPGEVIIRPFDTPAGAASTGGVKVKTSAIPNAFMTNKTTPAAGAAGAGGAAGAATTTAGSTLYVIEQGEVEVRAAEYKRRDVGGGEGDDDQAVVAKSRRGHPLHSTCSSDHLGRCS